MSYHLRLSDLARMSLTDSDQALASLVQAAKNDRNGQRAELDARVREFELRYEMSSDVMRERLRSGELDEAAEIVRWLMTLSAHDNVGPR